MIIMTIGVLLIGLYAINPQKDKTTYPLIKYNIKNISDGANTLSQIDRADKSTVIITLTEIKQNCRFVEQLISYDTNTDDAIIIGDLLYFTYRYIHEAKLDSLDNKSTKQFIEEITIVCDIFASLEFKDFKDPDDYFAYLKKEFYKVMKASPDNTIIQKYQKAITIEDL